MLILYRFNVLIIRRRSAKAILKTQDGKKVVAEPSIMHKRFNSQDSAARVVSDVPLARKRSQATSAIPSQGCVAVRGEKNAQHTVSGNAEEALNATFF